MGEETSSVGVSFSQVTVNGTELDFTSTGSRTSTPIAFSIVPLSSYVVTTTLVCLVFPSSAGNDSVLQPCSGASPVSVTQR